ncbi:unnamed protein product [Merluccius merluccius]
MSGDGVGADMSVNDFCRFCHKNLKIQGVISHSTKIFETTGKAKTVFDRLADLGLTLTKSPEKSLRTCQKCTNLLSRIERDLPVFRGWEEEEEEEEKRHADSRDEASPSPTAAHKRQREPAFPPPEEEEETPPMPLKKFCPDPPTPSRTGISVSARRSITKVRPAAAAA